MTIFDTLSAHAVVPVIALDDAAAALPLADALLEGGLPVAEITFRTDAARATIAAIAKARPELLVGAGTVLTEAQVDQALEAGARFALSPGLDAVVLGHAAAKGLPFAPGIMTPTDLQAALRAGCRMVKFFPAMHAGGPNMLKNIAAPYRPYGDRFQPDRGRDARQPRRLAGDPRGRAPSAAPGSPRAPTSPRATGHASRPTPARQWRAWPR